jgi:hypothetical protein
MYNTTGFILWKLSNLAVTAREGWFFTEMKSGSLVLVHPDVDCKHADCLRAGQPHRHTPTAEEKERMQSYVTGYEDLKREVRELEAMLGGDEKDVEELERMWNL